MRIRSQALLLMLLIGINPSVCGQEDTFEVQFSISVDEDIRPLFKSKGRLFITLSTNPDVEPKDQIWPNSIAGRHFLFARNFEDWNPLEAINIKDDTGWSSWGRTELCTFSDIPGGTYYVQVLWQQNFHGFGNKEEGNLYSEKQELVLKESKHLDFNLSEVVEEKTLMEHPLVKLVTYESDTLSKWWERPIYEKAVVLLPSTYYSNSERQYPVFYQIGGGDSDCIWEFDLRWNRNKVSEWWMSDEAPQVIIVYLDGRENGNIYHLDSDNMGPYGHSLIYEFIPYIEKTFRAMGNPDSRYIGGCSTGGYGSLALQLFYPDKFNGVFCFGPDPISFGKHMNVDLYNDPNFFYDQYGYQRLFQEPGWSPKPISWKDWLEFENVLGYSRSYLDSDHVLGTWSAIFGPKGSKGLPAALIDPWSGDIEPTVAGYWSRYDLLKHTRSHWDEIGVALGKKILICTEATDNYNLNLGVRDFELGLEGLENPKPDAFIRYSANQGGHCSSFWSNYRTIIEGVAAIKKPVDLKDQIW